MISQGEPQIRFPLFLYTYVCRVRKTSAAGRQYTFTFYSVRLLLPYLRGLTVRKKAVRLIRRAYRLKI